MHAWAPSPFLEQLSHVGEDLVRRIVLRELISLHFQFRTIQKLFILVEVLKGRQLR